MSQLKIFGTFIVLAFFVSKTNAQSGWTQGKGKYYVKAAFQSINSDRHFSQQGVETKNDDAGINSLGVYGEYGKSDKFTITAFVPIFTNFDTPEQSDDTPGNQVFENSNSLPLGDIELGAKYRLFKRDWIATAITGKLRLPLGGGEFNQGLTMSAGLPLIGFSKFATYANFYGGANNRPDDFSDEWRYGLEFGIGYNNKLWLFAKQDNIQSMDNVDIDPNPSRVNANELFGNGFETRSVNLELAYYVTPKFGISLSYLNTFDGQLVLKGNTYTGGLFWNLR
ncbi:hypothetical protein ACXGQW_05110 [Wenyingzhuangia sp. IMCC45533]